jgi:hypothetical protein
MKARQRLSRLRSGDQQRLGCGAKAWAGVRVKNLTGVGIKAASSFVYLT